MYIYRFKNRRNGKQYIGITTCPTRRKKEHLSKNLNTYFSKALRLEPENFDFEILASNLSEREAQRLEISLIKNLTKRGFHLYNLAPGGSYVPKGAKNGRARLSVEDVVFIKNNRDKPMMELYLLFENKVKYENFKAIYRDEKWSHIKTDVKEFEKNLEYGCQFTNGILTLKEVLFLREEYSKGVNWKKAYKNFKHLNENYFLGVYVGRYFKLVRPELFEDESLKKLHASMNKKGENNSRAKLSWCEVDAIRDMWEKGCSVSQIHEKFSQVSRNSIQNIIKYKTWVKVV